MTGPEAGKPEPPPGPFRANGSSSLAAGAPKRCASPAITSRERLAVVGAREVHALARERRVRARCVRPSASRPETASVTWPPTVRPKRESHAF